MASEIITGLNSYFTFKVGNELYAVNVGKVTKILEWTEITMVPNSPDYILGVVNVFGDVLPVFDARLKFGLTKNERTKNTCILFIVFEYENQVISAGIVVDSVEKVFNIDHDQIKPLDIESGYKNSEFTDGIASILGETVHILNIEKFFLDEEIIVKK